MFKNTRNSSTYTFFFLKKEKENVLKIKKKTTNTSE